ncbi:NAD(P)/FAD-dependent oxidoreductase [Natronospira bacteriovora]|uniref:FAD-binding oxidoreductase n=1 Tax=Natronospira bacteriovora TaxID=3069753 RepID=A0ABU0W3J5_9GAMM|nr:FAD-binding oxidoreductase [Natronospira sp. AB-CW4]MDQ2068584.1 FAD-binding oxidoreductase [Natronospira sp. AB-CW4]
MTESTTDTDFLIIGAGIVGVTAAHELQTAGRRVLLIDRDAPGAGASQGNAGHFATEQIFPIADASILWKVPRLLLDPLGPLAIDWRYAHRITPWLLRFLWNMRPAQVRRTTEALAALSGGSLAAWQDLLGRSGGLSLIRSRESLTVFEHTATGRRLERDMKQMQAHGVPVSAIGGDEARERVPALSDRVVGALHFTATGHVADPLKVLEHVWGHARQAGAQFRRAEARRVRVSDDGVVVATEQGDIHAGQVLIACGAHSRPLVRDATGVKAPLDTERGYHLMLPAEQQRLPMAIASAERRFIMTPMDGGLRLAGTVEFGGLERPENWRRAWVLREHANALLQPALDDARARPWMGFRPTLPDCLPVIDRVGPGGRLLMAFGHHHLGLTQSAFTARILTALANDQEPPVSIEPYRLQRFGRTAWN